jgi:hypothetical protein
MLLSILIPIFSTNPLTEVMMLIYFHHDTKNTTITFYDTHSPFTANRAKQMDQNERRSEL